MNETETPSTPLTAPERLALAQQAFERFHSRCFWVHAAAMRGIAEPEIPLHL